MSIATDNSTCEPTPIGALPPSKRGDWTWELVKEFPRQGSWTEHDYLSREFEGLVEYSNGLLEFLPTTTLLQQLIVDFLHSALKAFVQAHCLGFTAFAPLRVRIGERQYREPDVIFATRGRIKSSVTPLDGADLVMEVVSDSNEGRDRDLVKKRSDYASAGIPEYWIVDPSIQTITVLVLEKDQYKLHGEFRSADVATSALLPGFEIAVKACFDAARIGQ